jgi:protein phosphatase
VRLDLPDPSLVLLIGPAGCGKSTFAGRFFRPTEVLSSDFFRGMLADDERDMAATDDAFEVLHLVAAKRLRAGRLTVVDATNVQPEARRPLLELARRHRRPAVGIVFDLPEATCQAWNLRRQRPIPREVIRRHVELLRRSRPLLDLEGFASLYVIGSAAELAQVFIARCLPPASWGNQHV